MYKSMELKKIRLDAGKADLAVVDDVDGRRIRQGLVLADPAVDLIDDGLDLADDLLASLGEHAAVLCADKKREAQLLFHGGHGRAHCRLREKKLLRGPVH